MAVGPASKIVSPIDPNTGLFKATLSQEWHNGSTIAIFVVILGAMLAIAIGISIFFEKVHTNRDLSPKDPNYNRWYHVWLLQVWLGVATTSALLFLSVGIILLFEVFPGPQLTASGIAGRAQDNVGGLQADIVDLSKARLREYQQNVKNGNSQRSYNSEEAAQPVRRVRVLQIGKQSGQANSKRTSGRQTEMQAMSQGILAG